MNFRDFDTCWDRATELHRKLPGSRILQVAGYLADPGHADPRWQELPPRSWIHYVVEKDGKVLDPSISQFDPTAPKEYPLQTLLDSWEKVYQVQPDHETIK